jgi:hypothetical protein
VDVKKMNVLNRQLPILVLAAMAGYAWAQSGTPAVTSNLTTAQATVQSVYPDKRSLTLVGADGQQQSIFVGPDVKLEKIHPGDKVTVSYYQGVAAQIAKGDMKASDAAASTFTYKSTNGKPGGGLGASVTVTVKILGIDPGTNKVAFQQSDGSQHIIAVKSPNMQAFIKTLKPGDTVDVTYTESVAISVAPAAK